MRIKSCIVFLLLMSAVLSAQAYRVVSVQSDSLTLDAGRKHGVTAGLQAFVVVREEIGGSWHTLRMAKLQVSRVQESSSTARILELSDGFVLQPGQEVQFTDKLVPPSADTPAPAREKPAPASSSIPSGRSVSWYLEQGDASFAKKDYAKAREYFRKALEVDSLDPKARSMVARCDELLNMGEQEKRYHEYLSRGDDSRRKGEIKFALDYYLLAHKQLPAKKDELTARFKELADAHPTEWRAFQAANQEALQAFGLSDMGIDMVRIPGGSFQMGSTSSESDSEERPVHQVTLSAFYIGKYEVTQGQWQAVMGSNPSNFKKGDNYPVEYVSWDDVQSFITKLNQQTGKRYRLPTEAEWEYAARGGTTGDRYGNINDIAWYSDNSGSTTHPVGGKQPNGYGLYDTLGNVYEWCSDWYGSYSSSSQTNPKGPSSGSFRVLRGGSWFNWALLCRAPFRDWRYPSSRYYFLGFRLAADSL